METTKMELSDSLRKMLGLPVSEDTLSDFELFRRSEQAKSEVAKQQKQDMEKNNNE